MEIGLLSCGGQETLQVPSASWGTGRAASGTQSKSVRTRRQHGGITSESEPGAPAFEGGGWMSQLPTQAERSNLFFLHLFVCSESREGGGGAVMPAYTGKGDL